EVLKLCEMAAYRNGLLYIVHTNCGTTVERVRENFKDSLHSSIILESAPHYFKFNSSVYEGENGYRYTMTPPLRAESERLKLKDNIDGIDIIGTDHCPFSEHMKNKKYTSDIAMGVDGVKYSFLNMYTLYKEKIIPKFIENPAIIHGLYPKKGSLMVGSDGDIVVFDPNNTTIVNDKESIYDGQVLKGSIKAVFAKGNMIVNNNEFLKNSSSGSYIERRIELDKSFNKCRYI
ncbi:MAG: amidohydrolase family protein, partial [Clostridium sp.]|nr:amidohydrolase family protein [Clostridium sp.]